MQESLELNAGYLQAVETAMEELRQCRKDLKKLRVEEREVERRIRQLIASVLALNELLPPSQQKTLSDIHGEDSPTISLESASEVYQNVIAALRSDPQKEWRPRELQSRVETSVIGADPKQLYNALQRLTAKGAAVRLRHGLYKWGGAVIETADEIGEEAPLHDE